ncbi:MAG: VWA domain-containing protein [Gemmatimonadota bacterium]
MRGAASHSENIGNADSGELSGAEARDAGRLVAALRPRFRMRPASRGQLAPRRRRPRPIVLICDITGSMERYGRFLLRFAHALARSRAPLEVFAYRTRLTRITRPLRIRSADEALGG